MKRHGNLWEHIVTPENILLAYNNAKRGKSNTRYVKWFEKNKEENLLNLQRMLCDGSFTTSEYTSREIYEPKHRTIYKVPFYPDRIVQHALLQVVSPIWNSMFIHDSYSCRKNKGMHRASIRTMEFVRKYDYCLKCDISKFYPSINQNIMMNIVQRKIKCKPTLDLLENIIKSFPGDKNIPIGNYTSQWFGNLYMNELDQIIKHKLKYRGYVRYCDDFILFSNNKKELKDTLEFIRTFLNNELDLTLSKHSIFPTSQGVDFVGYRHFKNNVLLRKTTAKNIQKRMGNLPSKLERGIINEDQYRSSIASTEGWIQWANTYNLKINTQLEGLKEVL